MGGEGQPHVAVVVLVLNRRDDTIQCLRSLERVRWHRLSLIVVDNGSTDGTVDAVRSGSPRSR